MKQQPAEIIRLQSLAKVCDKAASHLKITSERLFATPMTVQRLEQLTNNPAESEQLDAFVSRFARLQDNLGAKLLPFYLNAVGERKNTLLENLDKAERLGIIQSADEWMTIRQLRNQMVHEYMEDLEYLLKAVEAGEKFVPELLAANIKLQELLQQYLKRIARL